MRMGLRNRAVLPLASLFAALVGCTSDMEVESNIEVRPGSGGVWLNTSVLGVRPLSELDLSGEFHRDVRVDQILIEDGDGWVALDHAWSEAGELRGVVGEDEFVGDAFLHSRWSLTVLHEGEAHAVTLTLGEIVGGSPPRYAFSYDDPVEGEVPLCDDDAETGHVAIVIGDLTVDPVTADMATRSNTVYLACTSGAVGKAVLWGYTPWELGVDDFEAVVRMVRADYCGDGRSWTKPGTPIQLADVWEIHDFSSQLGLTEALWGVGGAICLSHPRAGGKPKCPGGALPSCGPGASLDSEPGALIWTRLAPWSSGSTPH